MAGTEGHWTAPTLFDPVANVNRPEPNAQVCLKSDEKGFLDLLLTRITAAN
jgi:inosine-uridine nucleoside N-ribohydrolase